MDPASFVPNSKRPFDSAVDKTELRRRYHHPPPSSTSQSIAFRIPPLPSPKLSAGEALFRILCPAAKTGGVIGKGGSIIRQFREETGAKIRIDDPVPGCEERVILIVADSTKKNKKKQTCGTTTAATNSSTVEDGDNADRSINSSEELTSDWDEGSVAQHALLRLFERILKVVEEERVVEDNQGVVCRLLAPSNQVGCVLGRGGKIIEKIRHDSGAQVRVMHKDLIPSCASPGDELIQITGNYLSVRKALLSVSCCLQDHPGADSVNCASTKSSGIALHGTGSETTGTNHRMEEEVVFKLLCQVDKVGSLIGKGGSIIRALQSETGASIKIADAAPDSDERVVVISARENSEQRHSPAQDAVIRVHCRIAEIGFELGAAVVARLLVPSQQISFLLGKGVSIIGELRRVTGASIRVFPKEQIPPKYGSQNEEVVQYKNDAHGRWHPDCIHYWQGFLYFDGQVIGSLQAVQDALFQMTCRLREIIFPVKPHPSSISGSPYMPHYPEMPPPLFRPRHDPTSPGYLSSFDHGSVPSRLHEPRSSFPRGMDHLGPTYLDRLPYAYGTERPGHGPLPERQPSPIKWASQAVGSDADVGGGFPLTNGPPGSSNQAPMIAGTTVEVVIPQALLHYVYGENNSNLSEIRKISGGRIVVHDPRPGTTEGMIIVSGTPGQIRTAQTLIQAFILSEKNT